ncbi:ABC transporter permease [Aneurinibacillus sp. REN35]|uniref:ABC transporter permease n=1 Tax=Aneurinibacillus sp. REN35 TaxID=3237286 RepID=UPI003529A0BD
MGMYIVKRVLIAIPVMFGISLLSFFLIRLVPGDTVTAMLGASYSEEQAAALRAEHGLDKPLIVQYGIWIGRVLTGDFGESSFTGEPVLYVILERLPVTLELTVLSLALAVLIAIPLGALAAVKRNSRFDYGATLFGMLGVSIPRFWLSILLILFVSLKLGWLPSGGFVSFTESPIDNLRGMVMPVVAMGVSVSAVIMRMTRSSMLEVIGAEYIKMGRAKGVPRTRLIWRHALKNALIPVVTIIGIQAGYLLGGTVVIEQIFSLPGIGLLALEAITNRDYALLQGTILFIACAFVLVNLLVDIVYSWINPKIRY